MIDSTNFHLCTIALFTPIATPSREADYVSKTPWGEVSSRYWYTEDGVIRESNHWGRVASCRWNLYGLNEGADGRECVKCPVVSGFATFAQIEQNEMIREKLMEAVVAGNTEQATELRKLLTF